ncbi:MAG: protease SohB [Gammaproteobacteria bacterium]|nr:protease SohB [Gammaproteobacteria bacterium]
MNFLADYGLFAAKWFTVIATVLLAAGALLALLAAQRRHGQTVPLEVKKLNDKYLAMAMTLRASVLPPRALKRALKEEKHARRAREERDEDAPRPRVFVCNFKGDMRASAVSDLREVITAILTVGRTEDEVVAVIESPGGTIHGYGLAASQLARVRERGIPLTVAVDKVAASGGYMMACVADRIIAAPFAILGSIGVIAQIPNFNRLLRKHDIDFEQLTAGRYKRTLSLFGENTPEGRAKFQEEIEEAHGLFKEFVHEHRPVVDVEAIATGEHWFGRRALELKLVDALQTSDDYLALRAADADVFEVSCARRKPLLERLLGPSMRHLEDLRTGL